MHSDTLYQRMLEQEKAVEEAKEAGLPIPTFPSIVPDTRSPPLLKPPMPSSTPSSSPLPLADESAAQTDSRPGDESQKLGKKREFTLTEAARADLRKKVKDQPQIVKDLAERSVQAEAEADIQTQDRLHEIMSSRERKRKERREKGEATWRDRISGWLGW